MVIVREELHGIDIDDIGHLKDLLRIVFIHEECGNLKVFVDGGGLARNRKRTRTRRRSQAFYKVIDVLSVINVI